MPCVVVLVGPVGAGKSTVATRLAQLVSRSGMAAANVDLDDVAFMQCGGDDLHEFWRRAAVATAALVHAWLDAGVDVVVTHGPFFESDGFEILRLTIPAGVDVHHVLLRVAPDVAVTRTAGDPTRGISKDPAFVRESNDRLRDLRHVLPAMDLELDTTNRDPHEIAAAVMALLSTTGGTPVR